LASTIVGIIIFIIKKWPTALSDARQRSSVNIAPLCLAMKIRPEQPGDLSQP